MAQEIAQSVASGPAGADSGTATATAADAVAGAGAKPYPFPASAAVTANMKANRRTDTKPELALRAALHALGYRYRKDFRLDLPLRRVRPDVAFTRRKVAVFIDGCFWHGCPDHYRPSTKNKVFWEQKLAANRARDAQTNETLTAEGWAVIRVWEHEDMDAAANRIEAAVRATRR